MKHFFSSLAVLSALAFCGGSAHAGHPADASARIVCKDGSAYTSKGECGGHGGIDRRATNAKSSNERKTQAMGAAAAGRSGEVWATPATKTYSCRGDSDYGKSKEGQYMTEAHAKAKGWHAAAGTCKG